MQKHFSLSLLFASLACCANVSAQIQSLAIPQPQIIQAVNEANTVTLVGNVHALAASASVSTPADLGTPMAHMVLSLKGTAAQEAALDSLIAAQSNPSSPLYHQYLTPQSFATQFGAAPSDVAKVTAWLESHGLHVEQVATGNRALVFSGNAAQVNSTFQTEIRQYNVAGVNHLANATDPKIPAALIGAVGGVVKLHDFRHSSNISTAKGLTAVKLSTGQWTNGSSHYLTPADYSIIYDINPLYTAGINGTGQTIAVIARTDISLADVQNFRSTFGLKANDPQFIHTNSDPGVVNGDNVETTLDTEWAGAIAPNAAIKVIISSSGTSDGIDLSSLYAVNNNVAPVITLSYGSCEAGMGSSELSFYNSLWKQAATQGQSVLVSSGDSGAAGCDYGSVASHGQAVNGLCTSPYSTCVGGTQFADTTDPALYWLPTNNTLYGSAISYIPETVWNESGTVSGGSGLWSGGGGASITYPKPTWQTGPGVPADGKRDVPDVSLTAASHDGYFIAYQGSFYTVGGTSAAAPSFAGMVALLDQKMNARQGLLNSTLYPLAIKQAAGGTAVFHDTVNGNNSVPGTTGFAATTGYDRASGLGSVDANLLVTHWADGATTAASLSLSASSSTLTLAAGQTGQTTITSTASAALKAAVTVTVTGAPSGLTAKLASSTIASPGSGTDVLTVVAAAGMPAGTYSLTVTGTGGGQTATIAISVIVPTPNFTLSANVSSLSITRGNTGAVNVSIAGQNGFSSSVALSVSGLPTGVTAAFTPASISGTTVSALKFTVASTAAASTSTITISATGGSLTRTTSLSLVVVTPALTLTTSTTSLSITAGSSQSLRLSTVQSGFTTAVALTVTGLPTGVTGNFSPSSLTASGDSTLTLNSTSTAAAGTYSLTITATGGGITKTAPVTLVVIRMATCVPASNPATLTVSAGTPSTLQLSCGSLSGAFSGPLSVSVTGAPAGMTAALSATTLTPGATVNLNISTPITQTAGTYNLTYNVTGSGGFTKALAIPVTVKVPSMLTLAASQMLLTLKPGASGQVTLTTAALGGFSSAVVFSTTLSGTNAALNVSLSKASIAAPGSGTVVANITAPASLAPGNYVVQITAQGGTSNPSVYLGVTVANGPSFTFTVNTSAITVTQGAAGSFTTSSGNYNGGFNGQLSISITGLPAGANYGVTGANAANNLVNITYGISVSASTPVGTYPVTITATGSGISHAVTVQLTVAKGTGQTATGK